MRVALVIGNAAYPGQAALANPVNDAGAVADTLKRLGFAVIELRDGGKEQMLEAISRTREALKGKQGVGMLYYAGHGLQLDWRNYMVPVDAKLQAQSDIPAQLVDLSGVLEAFRDAGNRMNILVLDACRDNPFDNTSATKGLAPIDAPPGTFVAFATAAGNVADDGDAGSANGLYTRHLLDEIKKPGARVEDMFRRVRLQVRQHSQGRQVPSESSSLEEEFSFDRGFARPQAENEAARQARYNAEKTDWDRIKASRDVADFYAFMQRYPSGFISEMAQFRVDQLQKSTLVAQGRKGGLTTLASGVHRFALGDEYTMISTDLLTKVATRTVQRVTLATDDRVEINGGETVYDQMGSLIQDDSGIKDPPMLMVPADIALGKKWQTAFQNKVRGYQARVFADLRVLALEDLEIPGARIQTYKVGIDGYASIGSVNGRYTGTLWIEPRTMRLVRYDRRVSGGSMTLDNSSMVMVDYKPAVR